MSQYQPLQAFREADSDDDSDEDESFSMDSSGRPRKLCRCTKKRFVCCGLLFALLVLLAAIAGGVAAGAYFLTRPLNAGGGAAPAVSSSVSPSTASSSSSSAFFSPTPKPTPTPTPEPAQCSNDAEVCKGASNPLQYRVVTLPNDLRVLLISNNKTSTAGAAMDVRSGSFQDTIPGLAHFCEHMLFLGTKKYPDESEYAQFLSSNGGLHNAYTQSENTNFYFSVNSEKLEEALDRFSQFFISPLFNADAVDREISAVNSEYEKDKGIPGWHVILLMSRVADPRSAYSRFTIGNTKTLAIPGIRDQVTAYYNKRYSSNLMQLVIYGKEDLDQLQSWANTTFAAIPNKEILPPQPPNPAYPAGFSPRLIVYKPITSNPQLNIVWQTPPRQDLYRYGVESFVTALFTYRGPGSLSHYLKITNPWATALLFGKPKDTSGFALFSFIIALTQDGVANIEDVVAGVFGYIEMLKGSDDEELYAVWEGKNKLDKIEFDYASPPSDISSYAKDLAATMRTVKDPADFLAPPRRTTWEVRQVRSFLDNLTPDKSNVFFANPSLVYDNETEYPSIHGNCTNPTAAQHNFNVSSADLVEPYFDTMYAIYCTDTNLLQKWENPDIPEGTFVLPHFETYTPHNFTLLPLPKDHSKVPQLALDDKQGYRVWWMQDYQFRDPVVIIKCQAYTGAVAATVRDQALSVLYSHYVSELLTGITEKAAAASYKVNLELLPSGIAVQFSGYSDPDVVRRFMDDVLQGALVVSEASIMAHSGTLSLAYQQTLTVLRNYQSSKVPYDYAVDLAKLMLVDPRYMQADLLDELSKLNVTELPAVVAEHMGNVLKSVSRTECYATGNVDQDGAIMYSRKIMEKLTQSATSEKKQEENVRVVKLKQGTTALAVRTLNPQVDGNSAIMTVTEVGPMCNVTDDPKNGSSVTCSEKSLQTTVFTNVLSLIMSEACFDTLRTKEQLGYVVQCGATPMENSILTLYFLVQSFKSPPYLLDRIDNFTDTFFYDTVLDAKFFEAGLSAYKTLLQAEDKTLEEQVDRLWTLMHNQHYNFDLKETMLAATERVSHSQFADFYNMYMLGDLDTNTTTTVRELVVGAFSGTVEVVSFDVPDQVKAEDQYHSASEFKESAEYWDL